MTGRQHLAFPGRRTNMPQLCEDGKDVQKPWQTQEGPRHNFKHQLREQQSPQMVSEMFKNTKLSLSCQLDPSGGGCRAQGVSKSCYLSACSWCMEKQLFRVIFLCLPLVLELLLCSQYCFCLPKVLDFWAFAPDTTPFQGK